MSPRFGRRRGATRSAHSPAGSAGAFTPDSLSVAPRHLEIGGEWVASFAITGYPREVSAGWLQPLLSYPGRLDVSLHIEPIDPVTAATRLKKQLSKLESGRRHTSDKGRLLDPMVEAATEDAYDLSSRVARGEGKLFRLGLYLTVHATSDSELAEQVAAVRALAASLLMNAQPTTYRSLQGWVSCLPLALDLIGMRRTFDTTALGASFPFTSPDLPPADPTSVAAPDGVLYGFNLGSQGLVHWNRFSAVNYNAVILGHSGAGKSYLVKLETLRSLYRGVEVAIIDPEDEYRRLCEAIGGTYLHLGQRDVRINPFDLPISRLPDGRRTAPRDALTRRALFLHTVLGVLLGTELSAQQRAVLDRAILATYHRAGITSDPRTWTRQAPLLADLAAVLTASGDPVAAELGARLHPFVEGAFAALFSGPTTTRPEGHLTVFSLRDLPEEMMSIGTLLTLDTIWRRVSNPAIRRPRLITVDEAWLLMQDPAGARFLHRMGKAARKRWCGLTIATQDVGDALGTELGKSIVSNAVTQILLHQAPQAIDEVVATFNLSEGEKQFLLSADKGQGLLSCGTQRVAFQSLASPQENALITTDPAELATYAARESGADDSAFVDLGAEDPEFDTDVDGHVDIAA
ncbi:VirB4 family type IV secretion system protein [Amycolatopsis sp. NPDC059021]|uniref:VirB4 family type IV secretion system protein n=1 Tax=Amycolatopsis sp. NPDC059021 TaxID=3346704 RepID=UPI00366BCAB1